jgi:DNA-binding response OmpR family regulator
MFGKVLRRHLQKHKYQVHIAIDGESGLEMAKDLSPNLIFLDLMLPGMDGYQVCSALKADVKTEGIPVVMLTGKDEMESVWTGMETGAIDYISKSQPLDTLLPTIDNKIRLYVTNLK